MLLMMLNLLVSPLLAQTNFNAAAGYHGYRLSPPGFLLEFEYIVILCNGARVWCVPGTACLRGGRVFRRFCTAAASGQGDTREQGGNADWSSHRHFPLLTHAVFGCVCENAFHDDRSLPD